MENIAPMAQTISTYGLYAIIAILCAVVVYLFKRVGDLEKEVRTSFADCSKKSEAHASELAKLLEQTNRALTDNTRAFMEFQNTLNDLKSTIQVITGRFDHGNRN